MLRHDRNPRTLNSGRAAARPARIRRDAALRLGTVVLTVFLSLVLSLPTAGHASSLVIVDADLHSYSGGLAINLALTQTREDCGAPVNGQMCIRYSVFWDDTGIPLELGYGLIPTSDVKVTGSSISLSTDTSTNPNITILIGSGGVISAIWKATPGSTPITAGNQSSTLSVATVQGSVLGYTISADAQAAMLMAVGS